jgi:biopolymer transport protein ExbD
MALIRGRERGTGAQIFTASMADIVFLLIVFFVLTYKVEVDKTQMNLPETWVRKKVPEKAAVISIAPREQGSTIRVSTGEEMALPVSTIEEVITFASTEVAKNPDREFILKADQDVEYAKVDEVLDALKQSKAKFIFLLSEQLTADKK